MKMELMKKVCSEYSGQKVKVIYITSTISYWEEGILLPFKESNDGIRIQTHEPVVVETVSGTVHDSGISQIDKRKLLKILTPDGKTWENPAKEQLRFNRCPYRTTKKINRCPKCGGFMRGRSREGKEPRKVVSI